MSRWGASALDLRVAHKTLALLRQARQIRGNGRPAALLVPSRVDRRTAAGREIEAALHDLAELVAPAVAQRAAHADAAAAGQWIGDYAPRTAAHVEIQALTALGIEDDPPMTKRPSLRAAVAPDVAQAAATAAEMHRRQDNSANRETAIMTTATIHIPAELLNALRSAANRRSMRRIGGELDDGRGTRPSVSEIVVELLTRHRAELDALE